MLDGCGEEARAWGEGLCVGMELGGGLGGERVAEIWGMRAVGDG